MNPTDEQRLAVETHDRALLVEAGAGTGKTWVLVQRFLHLLAAHPAWPLESLIAITFTEKAAREMRTRLRAEIERKAQADSENSLWQTHRRALDRLQVSTVHSLCARLLRENALAAALDPRFQVLDEQAADLLKEEAIRQTLQVLDTHDHAALDLLGSLRVRDLRDEMASMLGKRGTMHELFRKLPEPEALLAEWKKALENMQQGLWQKCLVDNPDLQPVLEQLRYTPIEDPTDKLAESVQHAQEGLRVLSSGNLLEAATHWLAINLTGGKATAWGGKDAVQDLKDDLRLLREAAKTLDKAGALQEIGEADAQAAQHLQLWQALWEVLDEQYAQLKEAQQALDFDDLELLTVDLLEKSPRAPRLQAFLDGLNQLMVDEFQDTNLVQQRIVYALAPPESPRLFVVGDAKQSIYRFRQAQVSIFNATAQDIHAQADAPVAKLSTSFRTHTALVDAVNALFAHMLRPLGTEHAPYEATPGPLTAARSSPITLDKPVEMLLIPLETPDGEKVNAEEARLWEARWIAHRLKSLREEGLLVWDKQARQYRPFAYRDAAVLFRATTNLPLYEGEFKAAGLPYLTVSGRGYFDRPEVQDLIALLAALANPADDLNLAIALRSPLFSFSDETLYQLRWHTPEGTRAAEPIPYQHALAHPPETGQPAHVQRAGQILTGLWQRAGRVEVWALLHHALEQTAFETILALYDGETGRCRTNVEKFLALARDRGGVSLPRFLSQLRELHAREAREGEAQGREPESGVVQLMSIHASKGLEFPVVVVADLGKVKSGGFGTPYLLHDPAFGLACKVRDNNGDWNAPAGYSWAKWQHDQMEEAESKRLFYVACTRAADLLILTGKTGAKNTWLTQALQAWEVPEDGEVDEVLATAHYALRVHRPLDTLADLPVSIAPATSSPGFETVPVLAQPLPSSAHPLPVSVTRLDALLQRERDEVPPLRPAMRKEKSGAEVSQAPNYQVGNLVHRALAQWTCLEYSETRLGIYLANQATRLGLPRSAQTDAIQKATRMLRRFKAHALYTTIQTAQVRQTEVPFTLQSPIGLLHGVIDLLYQDAAGLWHLVDWKTEWVSANEREAHVARHLTQMAVYAQAVQQILRVSPLVRLCFLHPHIFNTPIEPPIIETAWLEVAER